MFSKRFVRAISLLLIACTLSGCAEINRRGGLIDQIEDFVLFRADTKSHRLWRSYLLIGVLLAVARRDPRNEVDQGAIAGNLVPALAIANEAFYCLYPGDPGAKLTIKQRQEDPDLLPGEIVSFDDWAGTPREIATVYKQPRWCQFFDEQMARLDYAIYRLALTTLFSAEGQKYLSDIRDQLVGRIPVVTDAAKSAFYANKVVLQTPAALIEDLLELAFKSLGPVASLLPLYRDALELNMIVVINTLQYRCKANAATRLDYHSTDARTLPGVKYDYNPEDDCDTLRFALEIFNRGNGNIAHWRAFIAGLNGHTQTVEAYRPHFLLVTQLMIRSCGKILSGSTSLNCKTVLDRALEQSAFAISNVSGAGANPTDERKTRKITASLFPFVQTAGNRPRTRAGRPADPGPDPNPTGSIRSQPSPPAR